MGKLDFMANLKAGFKKEPLKDNAIGAVVGGVLPIVIGTVLKLDGYTGWAASYLGTVVLGKALGYNSIATGALAVGTAHLVWTKGSDTVQSVLGNPPWRMGTGTASTAMSGVSNYGVLMDSMQPGASVTSLPAVGKDVVSYDATKLNDVKLLPDTGVRNDNIGVRTLSNTYGTLSNTYGQLNDNMRSPFGGRSGK